MKKLITLSFIYLSFFGASQNSKGNDQQKGESLMLMWPIDEGWKLGNSQETAEASVLEIIHEKETLQNWTEMGTMMAWKGVTNVSLDKIMDEIFYQSKVKNEKAKRTFIDSDNKCKYPWILFTIEAPIFKDDGKPESQIWYILQGKEGLYPTFFAVKKETLSKEQIAKYSTFFKTAQVVYK
jgi:hypothetical protein